MLKLLSVLVFVLLSIQFNSCSGTSGNESGKQGTSQKRRSTLDHLLATYRSDKDLRPYNVNIWETWLRESGELPPDFDELPTHALPPDILRFADGSPVKDQSDWQKRKNEIKPILQQYCFGQWPSAPPKISVRFNGREEDNKFFTKRNVQISFAPTSEAVDFAKNNRVDNASFVTATLNAELMIPKGKGPFPVILETGSYRPQMDNERLKRGYIVCRYSTKDTESFYLVYPGYDCNQLEWWAYGAGRCVDMLQAIDEADKSKIITAGHSRGAKTALLAALMDERIFAVINDHPGTGTGSYNLWRYAGDKYGGETLENSTRRYPYWNNPKMRFFIGRENKLPFDGHFLLAMLAPRPCLLGTGEHDNVGEPWGDQQSYLMAKELYKLLGHENNLGFFPSPGGHEVTPEMTATFLDWLDMQVGRKPFSFPENLIYSYSFEKWKEITGENINPNDMPVKNLDDILRTQDGQGIKDISGWESKKDDIIEEINKIIGDIPEYDKIEKADFLTTDSQGLVKAVIPIDDKVVARITYPSGSHGKLPVVIYLHAYLDANGYNWSRGYGYSTSVTERIARKGFLAVEFEQMFGYGKRNRDSGAEFYAENKDKSALGIMIRDVRMLIDAISLIDIADKDRIAVTGYSLGGMVALYSALNDERIKAVASTCGFASMRMDVHGEETEGLKRYYHLRPTIPRLGFFSGNENKIPYDYHEVLAMIAPRPLLVLAPKLDQDWVYRDVEKCCHEALKVYGLYGKDKNLSLISPDDFNRYPPEYQEKVIDWVKSSLNVGEN